MTTKINLILDTDSYKASHWLQYSPKTKIVNSYIEPRGVAKDALVLPDAEIVNFGLQMYLDKLTQGIIKEDIEEAKEMFLAHGEPFNEEGWNYILNVHGGNLPVLIEALPEGMVIKPGTAQVQLRNTDAGAFWLTSYLETALLRSVWYPSSVATVSREIKKLIYNNLLETSDDPAGQILFKLHDFGGRGVSSEESARIGGVAHLVNFMGTDTVSALVAAKLHYGELMAGFSIPAAEHSTITSWGKENEVGGYRNMLKQFAAPGKLVAVVSDSWNIYEAADKLWGTELKQEVLDSGATVVVRPDSGHPATVVTNLLTILGDRFGYTVNKKGYKVLHPSVRIIQGDGVERASIKEILDEMKGLGWSGDNVAFGMGGALLQKVNRDTFKYAMKTNAIFDGDKWIDVSKDPITDSGKRSKPGILSVTKTSSGLSTIRRENLLRETDLLAPVFKDGEILKRWAFGEVRENAKL